MTRHDDLITDLLARLRAGGATLPESLVVDVERAIRQDYGGDTVWIRKTSPDRGARIARDLAAGAKPEEVCKRHGVSLATVYRHAPKKSHGGSGK